MQDQPQSFTPSSQPQPLPSPRTVQEDAFTRTLSLGWKTFTRAWGLLVVASLALIAAGVPGGVLGQVVAFIQRTMIDGGAKPMRVVVLWIIFMPVLVLLSVCLQCPTQVGVGLVAIRASRGHTMCFGTILEGFRRFGAAIAASLLMMLIGIVAAMPGLVLVAMGLVPALRNGGPPRAIGIVFIALGVVVAVCISLWVTARLVVFPLRACDPDLPSVRVGEALRLSWNATRGNAFAGIAMMVVSGAAMALGFGCCCVGLVLFGMPLWISLQAGYYRAVFNDPDPDAPPPPPPWTGDVPPQMPA